MKWLSDMKEPLGRIQNKGMMEYMRERSAAIMPALVVRASFLSYIALFDNLAQKLHELARTHAKNIGGR